MSNNINWGKIYESTAWGNTDNSISWGKSYADLAGGGFDADYQAVLDRASSLGYTAPSASQQTLQNTLVTDLKTAGIWDKLDALYIMANDGSREFGRLNWASPSTFELSEVNSPTFTSNQGFAGDAISKTLDTGITLDTDTTHFSTTNKEGSFGGWSYDVKYAGSHALMGTDNTRNDMRGGSNDHIMGVQAGSGLLISGLYHMNVDYTGGVNVNAKQYQNGSLVVNGYASPISYTGATMHLLSEGGASNFSVDTISIAFIGGDLSAEASDLYNAFNTYMSAI